MRVPNLLKRYLLFVFCLCSFAFAFSEDFTADSDIRPRPEMGPDRNGDRIDYIDPIRDKILREEETVLEIETNVSGVEVYINDVYVGRSDVELKGFMPGFYVVELRKPGYEIERFWVEVRPGRRQTYSINMRLIVGYITLTGIPDGAKVYVDGSYTIYDSQKCFSTVPGTHDVTVECFGYSDYKLSVVVDAYENYEYPIEMETADFEIKDFKVSRNVINPKYKHTIGSTNIDFKVTASEPAKLTIENEAGEIVYEHSWSSFTKTYQRLYWDGCDSDGKILPDGVYPIHIESEHFIFDEQVTIDSNLSLQLFNVTKGGLGVGSLPTIFGSYNKDDAVFNPGVVYFNVNPTTGISGSSKRNYTDGDIAGSYTVNLDTGLIVTTQNAEWSIGGSFYPFYEQKYRTFYTSYKQSYTTQLTDNLDLSYGGLIRYGWSSYKQYDTVDFDTGNGLDFGALCSLDFGMLNVGLSSQYIIAAGAGRLGSIEKGREGFKNNIWENGITLSVQPLKMVSAGAWAALNNINALEAGCGVTIMPLVAPVLINVNCDSYILFDDCCYIDFGIELSYVF